SGDEDFKLRKRLFYRNTPLIPTVISKFSVYYAEKSNSVNNAKSKKPARTAFAARAGFLKVITRLGI
ncbi:hypothetical protein, partial [Vibrio parahaemolyticus]|uniref:hypothetical protein n=1 Tax=Vibrio parahaemolyticus TaxID=670 RepID=UPI0019540688